MTQERWLAMPGYEGRYEVSDRGRVRSFAKNTQEPVIKKQRKDERGYWRTCLAEPGRQRYRLVYPLVLRAFGGPRPPGMECAHLDGDKDNNAIENLAWVTHAENMRQASEHGTCARGERTPNSKLTAEAVLQIRAAAGITPTRELAKRFGVKIECIQRVLSGRRWKHVEWPPGCSAAAWKAACARKLNEDSVREIRKLRGEGIAVREIGDRFGVDHRHIYGVLSGRIWGSVT